MRLTVTDGNKNDASVKLVVFPGKPNKGTRRCEESE